MTTAGGDLSPASVVVAAFSGEAALVRCLESLARGAAGAEVVVASDLPAETLTRLADQFPRVRFAPPQPGADVFRLRAVGLDHSTGDPVVLLEDHCTVGDGWLGAIEAAQAAGYEVVGGPIDNGNTRTAFDWSLYFCEYSAYMPPVAEGEAPALLGANTGYRRAALWACRDVWRGGFHENEVHDALRAAGCRLFLTGRAAVASHLPMNLRGAMAHLYAGGRRFGQYRNSRAGRAARLAWVLASPLVPAVLLGRVLRRVWSRRPDRLITFLRGLPYAASMALAWSAGEARGYLAGLRRRGVTPAGGV